MAARLPPDGLAGEGPGPEGGALWKELSTYSRPPGAHLLRAGPRIGHCTGCSLSSGGVRVLVCTGHCTEVGGRGTGDGHLDPGPQTAVSPCTRQKVQMHQALGNRARGNVGGWGGMPSKMWSRHSAPASCQREEMPSQRYPIPRLFVYVPRCWKSSGCGISHLNS